MPKNLKDKAIRAWRAAASDLQDGQTWDAGRKIFEDNPDLDPTKVIKKSKGR